MDRNLVWNRVSQLPMALSGIVHAETFNGISLSIFTNLISKFQLRKTAPPLPHGLI